MNADGQAEAPRLAEGPRDVPAGRRHGLLVALPAERLCRTCPRVIGKSLDSCVNVLDCKDRIWFLGAWVFGSVFARLPTFGSLFRAAFASGSGLAVSLEVGAADLVGGSNIPRW